ncbi:MAG TPA: thiolase family protein [Myxococcales bacterium LLY-WYZ-16_1]|nr:thiolase family protein [Myxococcales bacterium LLY-WYZ-16_1]
MDPRDVVVLSAKRTPIGAFQGALSSVGAPALGSVAAKAALESARVRVDDIEEVFVGCVLPANLGQAPARQVALGAGLPDSVPCNTVNKVCGSGLRTVMMAAQAIRAGDVDVCLAGGIESMSNTPFYLDGARDGLRLGDKKLIDGMIKDGLWDVYNDYHMGNAAELCARECNVPRSAQDEFAAESYRRAQKAQEEGWFTEEIVPVAVPQRKGDPIMVDADEEPRRVKFEKIPSLKPSFVKDGTVTAANASSLNDGASMLVVASRAWAEQRNLKPLATIAGHGSAAQAPEWFTTAPAKAIERTLRKLSLSVDDIDLFEINEAFAVVSIANEQKLGLDRSKVNVWGGAVALGHPIGASGARILTTLLHAMKQRDVRRGLASLCIGGGEGVALVVER